MVEGYQGDNQQYSQGQQGYIYPNQIADSQNAIASISKILLESPKQLSTLRREFRGEALITLNTGENVYIQVSKPVFVMMDNITQKPVMRLSKIPKSNGKYIKKYIYVPNDEAIEEVLSMLKFAGLNQITPITNIDENNILDDLREFECKLAGILALKQKAWGLDKELLSMTQFKIKTIVQDARYMSCNGTVLKALQTTVSRIEQAHMFEGNKQSRGALSPYS